MRFSTLAITVALVSLVAACRQNSSEVSPDGPAAVPMASTPAKASDTRPDGWDEYWYSGLAEVSSYATTQRRYGQDREGTAVLIFVTEPFLPETQVKDDGIATTEESVSVLKLNRVERFSTGIYDYSIMQSVFTPVSRDRFPHTLKTSLSVQDWCGQVWAQYNLRKNAYQVTYQSYFQSEGDLRKSYAATLLEDELANVVRLDPSILPEGEVLLIPSEKYGRLHHESTEPRRATLGFSESETALTLDVEYKDIDRGVRYVFEPEFPHRLERWTVTQDGVVDYDAERITTLREPYWEQNANRFAPMRDSLGLQ